jgi:hypothetical protein
VTWNSRSYIDHCLDSLITQTLPNFEVILVDNGSDDGTAEYVRNNYPKVRVIASPKNLGYAGAINKVLRECNNELICLFNPDAVADEKWLSNLVQHAGNGVGAVAGKVMYLRPDSWAKSDQAFCTWSKVDPYTGNPFNFSDNEPLAEVDYVTGAAMLVRREAVLDVGPLDETYFLFFEETDWCARMIRAGYRLLYVPDATVWHLVSRSISDSRVKTFYLMRNRIRFVLKNFDRSYLPFFLASFALESLYESLNALAKRDTTLVKIRIRAVCWNLVNVAATIRCRRTDRLMIKRRLKHVLSYNSNLPLRKNRVGLVKQYLSFLGQ